MNVNYPGSPCGQLLLFANEFSDSTRAIYRKKLAISMRDSNAGKSSSLDTIILEEAQNTSNGDDTELQNGEYSADEEIIDEAPQDKSEDDQPSLVTNSSETPAPIDIKRISTRSASKNSPIANAKAIISDVRHRFSGKNNSFIINLVREQK